MRGAEGWAPDPPGDSVSLSSLLHMQSDCTDQRMNHRAGSFPSFDQRAARARPAISKRGGHTRLHAHAGGAPPPAGGEGSGLSWRPPAKVQISYPAAPVKRARGGRGGGRQQQQPLPKKGTKQDEVADMEELLQEWRQLEQDATGGMRESVGDHAWGQRKEHACMHCSRALLVPAGPSTSGRGEGQQRQQQRREYTLRWKRKISSSSSSSSSSSAGHPSPSPPRPLPFQPGTTAARERIRRALLAQYREPLFSCGTISSPAPGSASEGEEDGAERRRWGDLVLLQAHEHKQLRKDFLATRVMEIVLSKVGLRGKGGGRVN
jgi:hypothetical protein